MSRERIEVERLRDNVAEQTARIRSGARSVVLPAVSTTLLHNVCAESQFQQYGTPFTFQCDESVERGGLGEAPSPMRYLLSSIGFCMQVWCAKVFALHQVAPTSLTIDVRTRLDMRGELRIADVPAHPQWFVVEVIIEVAAEPELVRTVVAEARRRCPVTSLITRAAPIYSLVRHGGTVILDERTDEIRHDHEKAATQ
jgi:uncharacterized OsmC-like protein